MKTTKKSQHAAPKIGRPPRPESAVERQMVGTRLSPALYQKLVAAAASNGRSISAEMERRVEQSFEAGPPDPDDVLQTLGRRVMAAFEAGGQRASRLMEAQASGQREIPAHQWMKDPSSYTEAASRALETLVDWHPKPLYGQCLLMIYALRARADRAWLALLNDAEDEEERRKMIEHADAIARQLTPPPSLLDPLPPPPTKEKDES